MRVKYIIQKMGKRKLTEWQLLVKKIMDENKNKPGFKFGDALKLAKKMYGSKNKTVKKGGNGTCGKVVGGEEDSVPPPAPAVELPQTDMNNDSTVENQPDVVPPPPAEVTGGKRKRKSLGQIMGDAANRANLYSGVTSLSKDSKKILRRFKLAGKNKKTKKNRKGGAAIQNTNGGTPYFSSNK